MKNKKLIIGLSVAGLLTAGVLVALRVKKNREQNIPTDGDKNSGGCVKFPLKVGSGMSANRCSNAEVKKLQQHLNAKSASPMMPLVVDGMFGEKTASRLDRIYKLKQVSSEFFVKLFGF